MIVSSFTNDIINSITKDRKSLMCRREIRNLVKREVKKNMFIFFKHKQPNSVKVCMYSPAIEYAIVFKDKAVEEIKHTKGWKTDADMARALGLTRQYICNLKKRKTVCTHTVITRIASAIGSVDKNWHIFYELKPMGFIKSNEMQYNQAKSVGQIPYERFSITAPFRSKDHQVEVKTS